MPIKIIKILPDRYFTIGAGPDSQVPLIYAIAYNNK